MKPNKGTLIYPDNGSISHSYHNGWQKALENFEKYVKEFKTKRTYRLHSN